MGARGFSEAPRDQEEGALLQGEQPQFPHVDRSDLKYKFPHFVRACRGQPGPALVSHVRKVRLREGKSLPQGHTKKQLRAGLEGGLLDAVFASHHPALQAEFHTFLAQLAHRSVFPTLTGSYTDRQTTC